MIHVLKVDEVEQGDNRKVKRSKKFCDLFFPSTGLTLGQSVFLALHNLQMDHLICLSLHEVLHVDFLRIGHCVDW